jgi:hypothetical protein
MFCIHKVAGSSPATSIKNFIIFISTFNFFYSVIIKQLKQWYIGIGFVFFSAVLKKNTIKYSTLFLNI